MIIRRIVVMSDILKKDNMTEEKYKKSNFNPDTEDTKFSYTSGRVLKPVYNKYKKNDFKLFGYYTDWSQYDGRYENLYDDKDCGRGIDLMRLDPEAYDKIIIGFCGIVGDKGEKKTTIDKAATDFHRIQHQPTFVDSWGDVLSYRNCGFNGWVTNDVMEQFIQSKAMGVLGGLRKLREKNPNLMLSMSIGGWTMSEAFHWIASDPQSRKIFSEGLVDLFNRFPMFNAVDLDWEYPGAEGNTGNTYNDDDGINYAELVKNIKSAFIAAKRDDIEISIATSAAPEKLRKANINGMLDAGVDYLNVMTYDFFGTPWAKKITHHTNLHSIKTGDNEWSTNAAIAYLDSIGVPMKKINIGYAAYSRNAKKAQLTSFSPLSGTYSPGNSTTLGTFESGTTEFYDLLNNYLDIEKQKGKNGFNLYTDEKADADYLYNKDIGLFMSIDTPRTVKAKAEYIKKNGLNGLFTWTVEMDSGLLVNAAREGFDCPLIYENINMKPFYFKGINVDPVIPEIVSVVIDGPDSVPSQSAVKFSGEKSSSTKGRIISYLWKIPPSVTTNVLNESTLNFIAPFVDDTEKLEINLTVIDDKQNVNNINHLLTIFPASDYPTWQAKKQYVKGDKVNWKSKNWQAKWWSQGTEPGKPQTPGLDDYPWENIK